ncbi:hypothetical protein KCP78_07090 [Salmonella enterica subsp. enterica]|nr:hypothetical protein KCP78_07090 [Salmonella enterica subsp. enterica]
MFFDETTLNSSPSLASNVGVLITPKVAVLFHRAMNIRGACNILPMSWRQR